MTTGRFVPSDRQSFVHFICSAVPNKRAPSHVPWLSMRRSLQNACSFQRPKPILRESGASGLGAVSAHLSQVSFVQNNHVLTMRLSPLGMSLNGDLAHATRSFLLTCHSFPPPQGGGAPRLDS